MLTRKARYFLSLSAAVPLLFAAACTDNNIFGVSDVSGTYQLVEWAGNTNFPVSITLGPNQDPDLPNGGRYVVTGGDIILREDGTFTETNFVTKTPPGGSSFESDYVSVGTYNISGNTIQFQAPAQNGFLARQFSAQANQNQVVYVENNAEFAYQR
jgi:hypothetical protein